MEDRLLTTVPIRFSQALPNLHLQQFPLLNRPLQTPPSAAESGKTIRARIKPESRRLEVHVPFDTRHDVWNKEKGKALGAARVEDDKVKNQELPAPKVKVQDGDAPRLGELRMSSEEIPQETTYMLGIVRDGTLHLHPVSEVHQFRPTLTYLDLISAKNKRASGDGSDSDDGPPPDPDEPAPPPAAAARKEKKSQGEAKEVQMSAKKADDKGGGPMALQGGLSNVRREMLTIIRDEEDEQWRDLKFHEVESDTAGEVFENLFSKNDTLLDCKSNVTLFLKGIDGL